MMQIDILKDGLMLSPETAFEEEYLGTLDLLELKAFIKCGNSPTDILGLKIKIEDKEGT